MACACLAHDHMFLVPGCQKGGCQQGVHARRAGSMGGWVGEQSRARNRHTGTAGGRLLQCAAAPGAQCEGQAGSLGERKAEVLNWGA